MEATMAKNPVDDYLEKRGARDDKHLQLWQTWKANPSPQTMQPLLNAFNPTFTSLTKMWKAPNVSESAFKAELQTHAIKAFENYDPDRGASLLTYLTNTAQKAKRFNTRAQNMAYIPEDKAKFIGKIDTARDSLREELGRDPTHAEIGGEIGLSGKRVGEIQGLRRADIRGSAFQSDPTGHTGSRDREIIALLRPELDAGDQAVYDYLYGENGKPKITETGLIASRIGKSASHVSRAKNRIAAAYNKYAK